MDDGWWIVWTRPGVDDGRGREGVSTTGRKNYLVREVSHVDTMPREGRRENEGGWKEDARDREWESEVDN